MTEKHDSLKDMICLYKENVSTDRLWVEITTLSEVIGTEKLGVNLGNNSEYLRKKGK